MTAPKVKRCKCCNEVKSVKDFYRNFSGCRGEGVTCKKCIDTEAEHRKQIEEENAGTTRAAPRAHIGVGPYEPSDRTYYRNEGNKHIPSRGCV